MSSPDLRLSHRQFVSAIIALVVEHDPIATPLLGNLGYRLNALEIALRDRNGNQFTPDLHLVNDAENLSMLVDCKCSANSVDSRQLECYLATGGTQVVSQALISPVDPRAHRSDSVFFALGDAASAISAILRGIISKGLLESDPGFGLITVSAVRMMMVHDELSEGPLSEALVDGWDIDLASYPLELLPFEPSSPDWELAHSVLQTIEMYFVERREAFDVEDICIDSHAFWDYLGDQQIGLRSRIRRMMRNIRRTALKGWLEVVPGPTAREERWQFSKKPTTRANVHAAMSRRATYYVDLLRRGTPPRAEDFADVDQLPLQIHWEENNPS